MTHQRRQRRQRRRGGHDEAQAATELALVVPFFVLLMLAVVQVGLLVRDQVMVIHAAREGARAAAVVDGTSERARLAAMAGAGLDVARLRVDVERAAGGDRVRVVVRYRSPTDVPLVGPMLKEVTVTAAATMATEK